ncbi:MAG: nucleoside triphosphate pyrophosphohydrolase [Deltaproteobacteria bacterium]|nr:nucleoside triphosphate pyrophosphohydrolase [Deltaproteobacteria bacterium]
MSDADRFARAGAAFKRVCETMARLRAPGGCAWDREQTLESLKAYLVEEAYEVLDAMDGAPDTHRDELGDLLLQVVFQAEVCAEAKSFDIADVVAAVTDKLVRRHPHVFAGAQATDAASALAQWEAIKAKERPAKTSVLDGIPRSIPALVGAMRTGEKAAAAGFDWTQPEDVAAKVDEEWSELKAVLETPARAREELGDLLFALSNLARHLGIDPESALRAATGKFNRRFRHLEAAVEASRRNPRALKPEELDALWRQAKKEVG